jgi:hypothetical protein
MRLEFMKRFALGLVALVASVAVGYAVNITGTDSTAEYSIHKVGYVRHSVSAALTAFAGGGQANATTLDSAYNIVTVVATAADSVKLPSCVTGLSNTGGLSNTTGMEVIVTNSAAANAMNVYPQTGQNLNQLAANTPFSMVAGKTATFFCSPLGGTWWAVLSA